MGSACAEKQTWSQRPHGPTITVEPTWVGSEQTYLTLLPLLPSEWQSGMWLACSSSRTYVSHSTGTSRIGTPGPPCCHENPIPFFWLLRYRPSFYHFVSSPSPWLSPFCVLESSSRLPCQRLKRMVYSVLTSPPTPPKFCLCSGFIALIQVHVHPASSQSDVMAAFSFFVLSDSNF